MWAHFATRIESSMQVKLRLSVLRNKVSTCLSFLCCPYFFVLSWRPLGFFWRFFGASVVSFACLCHPCRCLWLAWAVCGLSLLLLVVSVARLDFLFHFAFRDHLLCNFAVAFCGARGFPCMGSQHVFHHARRSGEVGGFCRRSLVHYKIWHFCRNQFREVAFQNTARFRMIQIA